MSDQPDPLATVRAALDLAAKATPGPWAAELDIFDSDEGIVATVANKAGAPGDAWIPAQLLAVIATDLATTHDEYREDPAAARAKMEAQWRQARDGQELRDAAAIAALRNAAPAIADLCREVERLRASAAPRHSTVGELLATAPVIEICTIFGWMQMRADGEQRAWLPIRGWGRWGGSYAHDFHGAVGVANTPAARLVPASEADRDPASRGPIGEG